MPIYEYLCSSCEHRFEVKQKFSDPPISGCIHCGEAVTKVISAPAIMFKGSGWYITDYSDKLKAPGQTESADKPASGQNNQKASSTASSTETGSASNSNSDSGSKATSTSTASTTSSATPSSNTG
ncbi:MAG: hypothetical protein C4293_01115 [Nitrospiraceae bacterium]